MSTTLTLFRHLTLKEKILLSLYVTGAVIEEVGAEAADPFGVGYFRRGYNFTGADFLQAREQKVRRTLYSLKIGRLIRRARARQADRYQLTAEGLDLIFNRFPKLKHGDQPWDGFWRVVVYDIPERNKKFRNRLRYELKHLGLKFVQNSVWVTPLPIEVELEAFLKREGLWGRVLILKSRLPESESRRWAKAFRPQLPSVTDKNDVAAAVARCLADPHLPRDLDKLSA